MRLEIEKTKEKLLQLGKTGSDQAESGNENTKIIRGKISRQKYKQMRLQKSKRDGLA